MLYEVYCLYQIVTKTFISPLLVGGCSEEIFLETVRLIFKKNLN